MTPPAEPSQALEKAMLRHLSRQYPTIDAAVAEIARLAAELTLPKGTVHVISDIHGDHAKLRHVINNASGTLRPLVEKTFAGRLTAAQLQEFLTLLFYPRETMERLEPTLTEPAERRGFCRRVLRHLGELVWLLGRRSSLRRLAEAFPADYRDVFRVLFADDSRERGADYGDAMIDQLLRHDRAMPLIRLAVRGVRNLAVDELVIGGDCWDRGPRGDKVVDYIMRQPHVSFIWGNHDAAWLGACLGHKALIAHVLRISTRYRRLTQLEEGYGINLQPLEHLVRTVYANDPAACFVPKGAGLRDPLTMARLQKAAAVMQFKLEGQMIERHPEWNLDHRRFLHWIDRNAGTVTIDGVARPLRDTHFPTLDPTNPYELSAEERTCLERIRQSFLASEKLWDQMRYLIAHGSMYLCRDDHLIFHGCVPVDDKGEFLDFPVDGRPRRGRALFDALEQCVARVLHGPTDADRDLLWYLWCGPLSPLFGKDRITTFENDLVADPSTHVETKNLFFQLIHEVPFCDRVLAEFGVDPQRGLIVNGHVPVKIEKGESPLKRSGKAITIDGAFSAAYGDHGYTLLLEPGQTLLARHHHFESVEAAVREGVDIIPAVTVIRKWETPRRVGDTERGVELRGDIELLERLVEAYQQNQIRA
jgi:fructose-1,6-bisphosphatase-3